jgi:hypothetical protein
MDQTVLVDQPTASPTKKMQAVGVASLLSPIAVAFIATNLPALSQACAEETGLVLTLVGLSAAQGAVTFVSGYLKRNAATPVVPARRP